MKFLEFKDLLFEKAKIAGFEECEIYFDDKESISIGVYDGEVDKYDINKSFGLSFRAKINEKMAYSYTEILDEDAIDMMIDNCKKSIDFIQGDESFIYCGDKTYSEVKTYSEELENINPSDMIDLVLELEQETKKYPNVVSINGCKISYSSSNYGIYNTKGLNLKNKYNILSSYVVPVVEDKEQKQNAVGYKVAKSLSEINPKEIAKMGVDEATQKLGASTISSGSYNTLIQNEAMVSLLETYAVVFSGDSAQKGLSLLKGKEGEKIASSKVSIIDDPLMDYNFASAPFDDEGVATYKKDVVYNGKLNTLLHNLKTAKKQGVKSTGNGFKSSYASSVGVSESNMYIACGDKNFDDLLKEINNGVLITELAGLHSGANTISGDFSLAAKGFMIEDSKKTFPIEQITLAGNFFDLLKNIEQIGDDLVFPLSNIGCPSVIVSGLSIAGK